MHEAFEHEVVTEEIASALDFVSQTNVGELLAQVAKLGRLADAVVIRVCPLG